MIHNTLAGVSELEGTIYLKELNMTEDEIRKLLRVQFWHGPHGMQGCGKYLFEQLAGIHCDMISTRIQVQKPGHG